VVLGRDDIEEKKFHFFEKLETNMQKKLNKTQGSKY
jgi:hypothetical protein